MTSDTIVVLLRWTWLLPIAAFLFGLYDARDDAGFAAFLVVAMCVFIGLAAQRILVEIALAVLRSRGYVLQNDETPRG